MTPDREEALRLARGWEAKPLPTEKITPEGIGVVARALLALAADLEAAEQRVAELESVGRGRMFADRERAEAAERDLATAREALRPFAGLADDEWPDNSEHNRAVLKRMVGEARAALRSLDGTKNPGRPC